MLKLFASLVVFLLLALAMLGLHHHRMELTAQTARLRDQIRQQEQILADQRVQIAKITNPLVLAENLKNSGVDGSGIPPAPSVPLGSMLSPGMNHAVNADLHPGSSGVVNVASTGRGPSGLRHRSIH